jgi:hypothetical protein
MPSMLNARQSRIQVGITNGTIRISLFLLLALSGCTPDTGHVHGFRVVEEGAVTIATTTGGPQFTEDLFVYTKTDTILSDSEVLESILERPNHMLMGEDGALYVADDSRLQILQYDREGLFIRAFGRRGQGPGEFQSVELLEVRADTLAVYDAVLGRTTLFRTSGQLIDVFTLPTAMPRGYSSTAVMQFYVLDIGKRLAIERSIQQFTHTQFRATMLDSQLDSLWTVSTPLLQTMYNVEPVPGFSGMISGIVYGPQPAIAYHRGAGLIVSLGDRPELLVYSDTGMLVLRIRVDLPPQRVSAEERKKVTDLFDQRISDAKGPLVAMRRAQKDALIIAEWKPAWTSMQVDEWGYYWLAISETVQERRDAGGTQYRVLAPDGRYLGNTRWPTSAANARVSRGHLVVIETDEVTMEPIPTVYRISSAVPGFRFHK